MILLVKLSIMVLTRFYIFSIFVSIIAIFPLSNCTGDSYQELEEKRDEIGDEEDSFSSSRRYSRRSSSRRSSSRRSSSTSSTTGGSTTGGSTINNPYGPRISRNPIDEYGKPIPLRGSVRYDANEYEIPENNPCKGNILWLRENCNRLPTWLNEAASNGYEQVEITSSGRVIWHWGIFLGVWRGDTWKGGAFFGGIWESGVWEYGVWRTGEFRGGTWENGLWCDGIFNGGTWENGEWLTGVFRRGNWEDGLWDYGLWEASNSDWKTGSCYFTNQSGRVKRHDTDESPVHQNSLCRNEIYDESIHEPHIDSEGC